MNESLGLAVFFFVITEQRPVAVVVVERFHGILVVGHGGRLLRTKKEGGQVR